MSWYVYIVECADGSFYTGITTDPVRRAKEHNSNNKIGAKSLRGKRPVKIVYIEEFKSKIDAAKRESAIKTWKRENKLKLILRNRVIRAVSSTGRATPS